MSEKRYVIYLTGKVFDEYLLLQNYFISKHSSYKKPSLGMHCTLLRFYSDFDENSLIKEFNNFASLSKHIQTHTQQLDIFTQDSVVLRLEKTSPFEKLHNDCLNAFRKYEHSTSETRYIGENYNPHITICHVSNIASLPKISIGYSNKLLTLDKIVLARKENIWTVLSEKNLIF